MLNISKLEVLVKNKGWSKTFFASQFNKNKGWISDMKRGVGLPDENTLMAIADKLDTTVDYLTDKTEQKNKPILTKKDELDIKTKIDDLLNIMSAQKGLMFDGDPLSPEALESIKNAMELGMTAAKLKNKEKYNPYKNKKVSSDGRRNGVSKKAD